MDDQAHTVLGNPQTVAFRAGTEHRHEIGPTGSRPAARGHMIRAGHADDRPENGTFQRMRAREHLQLIAVRGQAARTVAQQSANADDCRRLLSMLGLDELSPAAPPAD